MRKVLVSIDERLLARVDRAARRSGMTRSAFLARLVADRLGGGTGPGADKRARSAMGALDALFRDQAVSEDATVAVRADRDSR